jgi:hypothetical protein
MADSCEHSNEPSGSSIYLTIWAIIRISSRNLLRGARWVYIRHGSSEMLLCFKPNDRPPDEFFEPFTEMIIYVLVPRTVLSGPSVSMNCAAESCDITSVLLLDVHSLAKGYRSTKILISCPVHNLKLWGNISLISTMHMFVVCRCGWIRHYSFLYKWLKYLL